MRLEDLKIYNLAMQLGDRVWDLVETWSYHHRDTLGKQVSRSVDSVAANIAEGFGRYHYKENKLFLYYSRGSLYETKTWLSKAHKRRLISDADFKALTDDIEILGKKLNTYINSIGKRND